MTWHLKDQDLERKLLSIDPEFLTCLQKKQLIGSKAFRVYFGDFVLCADVGTPRFIVTRQGNLRF